MLKILLTGGNGFIGKNIVEQLGCEFVFLAPTCQELDLTNAMAVLEYLKESNVDFVIHGANIGGKRNDLNKQDVVFANLKMFFNIIRAKKYFNRMIVLGSGAEYDKSGLIQNISEKDFSNKIPIDYYGFSKYVMAEYAKQADYITHLRLFGVFGTYEDYEIRFISNAICKALFGLPITIKQNVYFDYIHVNDLIKIIKLFLNNSPKNIDYNIGTGQPIDLISIAKIILKITGKDLPIIVNKIGLNNEYTCNVDRFKKEFLDFEYMPIEKSIEDLIEYYKKILPTLDKAIFLKDI